MTPTPPRPTPETDAEIKTTDYLTGEPVVVADFARKLERERDEARENISIIRNMLSRNGEAVGNGEHDFSIIEMVENLFQSKNYFVRKSDSLEQERDEAREQIRMMIEHDKQRLESDSIVGSCDCLTKTPEIQYHKPGCKYRLLTERDEAREEIENLKASTIHTCHSGCKRPLCMANREIKAMREAIKEAYEALEWATTTMNPPFEWEAFTHANAALAKLQPFIKP